MGLLPCIFSVVVFSSGEAMEEKIPENCKCLTLKQLHDMSQRYAQTLG